MCCDRVVTGISEVFFTDAADRCFHVGHTSSFKLTKMLCGVGALRGVACFSCRVTPLDSENRLHLPSMDPVLDTSSDLSKK
jgi:hypothetical protein